MKTRVTLGGRWQIVSHADVVRAARAAGVKPDELEAELKDVPDASLRQARYMRVEPTFFEAPVGDEWIAAYRIVPQDGAPVVAEVRLYPAEPTGGDRRAGEWHGDLLGRRAKVPRGGITARLVHQIRVGEHLRDGVRALEGMQRQGVDLAERGMETTTPVKRRRGPEGRSDRFYAELARDVVEAWKAGSRSPASDVARRRKIKRPQMRDMLHAARLRGLLSEAVVPGRVGGAELTNRARTLLLESPPRRAPRPRS